jgi:WD40 repeat protein
LISTVQVSLDGKALAVRRGDGQIALWDWAARRRLPKLPRSLLAGDIAANPLGAAMCKDIAFFPFGSLLAIGSTDARGQTDVVLWDANTGTERGRFPHRAPIASLAPSPDGRLLAIFDVRRRVTILDVQSRQACAPPLEVATSGAFYRGVVKFSPDGERLAVGDNDGRIRIVQWRTGAEIDIRPQPPANGIMALAWSPTEPLLASTGGYEGRAIKLWNPLTGEPVGELPGHTDWTGALAFTTNGEFLASANADRTVRVWRVADRTEFRCFRGHRDEVWTVAFLPDGQTLVSGDKEGTVRFWSLSNTNRTPSHEMLPERVFAPPDSSLAFAPDSRTFLTACRDGRVRVWSTQPVRELEQPEPLGTNNYAVSVSMDGRWLAVADRSGAVRIWDWPARRALTNLTMPSVLGGILSFSPRGRFLWAGLVLTNYARAGRIWETGTWRELPPPPIDYNGIIAGSVSPDEQLLAAGYASGEVKLWSIPTGDPVAQPRAHAGGGVWVAFAPDGRTLASAAGDGFVQLWDVPERRLLARFQGDRNTARGPAFSSDGRRLALAGGNTQEALKLWDVATLRELIALPAEGLYFMRTAFSPDGDALVAIDSNGVTHLWHAPSFAEIEMAERAGGR